MRHAPTPSLCAAAAIAAALTLGTTPAGAQEAAPRLDLESLESAQSATTPETAPETAEAPEEAAVSPTSAPQAAASDPAEPATTASSIPILPSPVGGVESAPVIEDEPPTTAANTTKSTATPAERTEPTRSVQADSAPAPAASAADETSTAISETGGDVAGPMTETGSDLADAPTTNSTLPRKSIADPAVAAADTPAEDPFSIPEESIVALFAALGLGAAGFMAMRSRRRREKPAKRRRSTLAAAMAFETKPETAPTASDELAVREPASPETQPDKPAPATAPDEPSAKPEAEEGPVLTGEAREKLIQQMVAAPPDEENPFTSAKARRKRARIILQRRANEQGQQSGKPFDWRAYKPMTKSPNPSSPPLVTV